METTSFLQKIKNLFSFEQKQEFKISFKKDEIKSYTYEIMCGIKFKGTEQLLEVSSQYEFKKNIPEEEMRKIIIKQLKSSHKNLKPKNVFFINKPKIEYIIVYLPQKMELKCT